MSESDLGVEHRDEEEQDELNSELQGDTEPALEPWNLSLVDPRSRIA